MKKKETNFLNEKEKFKCFYLISMRMNHENFNLIIKYDFIMFLFQEFENLVFSK